MISLENNIAHLVDKDVYIKIDDKIWHIVRKQIQGNLSHQLINNNINAMPPQIHNIVKDNVFSKVLNLVRKS